jgi:membrane protease YdiL (CAAX protease family)
MKLLRDSPRWIPLAAFFAIYVGSVLISAPLAPLVHRGLDLLAGVFPLPLLHHIASKPLAKILDRIRWLPLAIGLVYLLRRQNLWSWERLGLRSPGKWMGAKFFFLGMAMPGMLAALQLIFLPWEWRSPAVARTIGLALPSALVIGFLEEVIFRGLLRHLALLAFRPAAAAGVTALFFAAVHFGPPAHLVQCSSDLLSSLLAAGGLLGGIFFTFQFLPFLFLFCCGFLLFRWAEKFSSLVPGMGFHCGLAFVLILHRRLFFFLDPAPHFLLGTGHLTDSPICLPLLALCCGFVARYFPVHRS